jgi:hypothetical protein
MTLTFIYRHPKAEPICLKISNFYIVTRKWMDSTIKIYIALYHIRAH